PDCHSRVRTGGEVIRNRKATVLTALMLSCVAAGVLWREGVFGQIAPPETSAAANQPQDTVYAMLDSIRDGDLSVYFDCYTGSLAASLKQTAAEMTDARFLEALRQRNAVLKGVTVMEPELISDREARAKVEYIYAERNESQIFFFERLDNRWRITRVDGAHQMETVVPYGTPVE
ncbi:MAG: hypothetical protein ACRD7E_11750, partial [Bryobacteraceae bacterium]